MELIDGVFYDMGAPLFLHQDLAKEIILQLEIQLKKRGGPCRANFSPVDIILGEDRKTILQPDVFILCDRSKRRKWGVKGAPDFILEILSPSTRRKDMTVKYRKYKECGVKEYWMLDIQERRMIICDLEGAKPERIIPLEGKEGLLIYQGEVKLDLDAIRALMEEDEHVPVR
jgi:Uma2 family endonuclease